MALCRRQLGMRREMDMGDVTAPRALGDPRGIEPHGC